MQLGSSLTQNFTFTHGQWNLISFYCVDTSKTTIHSLFGSIPTTGVEKIIIFDQGYNKYTLESGVWSPLGNADIHFDSGYYVKVLFSSGSGIIDVNWDINGMAITYLETDITSGFNFISWPKSYSSDGSVLINKAVNSQTVFFDYLRKLFTPSGAAISGKAESTSAIYNTGDIILRPNEAYIINVSAFSLERSVTSTKLLRLVAYKVYKADPSSFTDPAPDSSEEPI